MKYYFFISAEDLKFFIDELEIEKTEFASFFNVTPMCIHHWLQRGTSSKKFNEGFQKILEYLDFEID